MSEENHRDMVANEIPWGMSFGMCGYDNEKVFQENELLQQDLNEECLDEPAEMYSEKCQSKYKTVEVVENVELLVQPRSTQKRETSGLVYRGEKRKIQQIEGQEKEVTGE